MFNIFSILSISQEKGGGGNFKIKLPILILKGTKNSVVKGLETRVPRIAVSLLTFKSTAVGREKSRATPKVGIIPQKTPMANPIANLWGESLAVTIFLNDVFTLFQ